MPNIRWLDADPTTDCLVCGSTQTRLIAEVDAAFVVIHVERCGACGSLSLVGPMLDFTPDDTAIDDYVEGGAGIDAIFRGLCRAPRSSVKRFLDVGCNYGFGVHLAARVCGWDSLGIEPSPAGRRGRAELGVEILDDYLEDSTDLGEPFDLILASEVVEHVTDPVGFLAQLRRRLAPSGVLVLTTPAAEVMIAPIEREEEAIQALSPGSHRFLASVGGMRLLLEKAGFSHLRILRRGATLQVCASLSATRMASIVDEPKIDEAEFLRYLDETANAAPSGSALASGMAARHFRACVMHGDFTAADKSCLRLRDAMLARGSFDLDDPRSCVDALRSGQRPAWLLPGVAYARGILEFIGHLNPSYAIAYFELTDLAARAWRDQAGLLDVDVWNLRELSLGHRCLALAACDPEAAGQATNRLAEALDRNIAKDALRIAWWKARTFNELVARGHLREAESLSAEVEESVERLVSSGDVGYRRAGLDGLFLLGIRALNGGSPTVARLWFIQCVRACDQMPSDDVHAAELGLAARLHETIAVEQGGTRFPPA